MRPVLVLASITLIAGCNSTPPSSNTAGDTASTLTPDADATPGFNHRIPESILTQDEVETPIGTMRFFDGFPDDATVELAYDNLDRSRAMEAFLDFVPMASLEALRLGQESLGATKPNQVLVFSDLMTSDSLFLTGNTDTVYASAFFALDETGPMVVEVPPGSGPGTVNDAYFRFVTDMGGPGPDRGKGGNYLILPPDWEGDVPEGYFVSTSPTFSNWVILRGFLEDGKTDAAVDKWTNGLRIYPLSQADQRPKVEVFNGTGKVFNTIHSNDSTFFDEVNEVIQREPVEAIDPEIRGNLASLGIQKGKPFEPNDRMRRLLAEGVAMGNATARALSFRPRSDSVFIYGPDSAWYTAFDGGDYRWLRDDGDGGRNHDARTQFFYIATVNTPAMVLKIPGVGSQYAVAATDSEGRYLDGAKNYSLTLPPDVPANKFWSIVAYDPQTRSMLQTGQAYPSINSVRNTDLQTNADGSTTLWFGPNAPEGRETNWIQTKPGKGWFTLLRLYGPLEPWFDQTWRPGEFIEVD